MKPRHFLAPAAATLSLAAAGLAQATTVVVSNLPVVTSSVGGNASQTATSTPTQIMAAVSGKQFVTVTGWCFNPNTTGVRLTFNDALVTPFYVPPGLMAPLPPGVYLVSNGTNAALSFTLLDAASSPLVCSLSGNYK